MPLTLAPSFDEHTRAEIEQHLTEVRSRRMLAAIVYQQGVNAKLEHEVEKVKRKRDAQYSMLLKELSRLDIAFGKAEARLAAVINLDNELGLAQDMIVYESKAQAEGEK